MRTAGGPGIRLDDLLARGITLQWAEAVALVQATCRQLVLTAASGFPSTAQIMLYEEGAAVTLATVDQPQVRAAAHLLASVLAGGVRCSSVCSSLRRGAPLALTRISLSSRSRSRVSDVRIPRLFSASYTVGPPPRPRGQQAQWHRRQRPFY